MFIAQYESHMNGVFAVSTSLYYTAPYSTTTIQLGKCCLLLRAPDR